MTGATSNNYYSFFCALIPLIIALGIIDLNVTLYRLGIIMESGRACLSLMDEKSNQNNINVYDLFNSINT